MSQSLWFLTKAKPGRYCQWGWCDPDLNWGSLGGCYEGDSELS